MKNFVFLVIMIFISAKQLWAATELPKVPVFIRGDAQTTSDRDPDFRLTVKIKAGSSWLDKMAKGLVSEPDQLALINLSFEAQSSFLTDSTETVIPKFKALVDMQDKANWDESARRIIFDAHFRLHQLMADQDQKFRILKSAYCFDSQLEPNVELVGQETIADFNKVKKSVTQALIDWDRIKSGDAISVNGKLVKRGQLHFICNDSRYKLAILSARGPAVDIGIKNLTEFSYKNAMPNLFSGDCTNPIVEDEANESIKVFVQENVKSELFVYYGPTCLLRAADLVQGRLPRLPLKKPNVTLARLQPEVVGKKFSSGNEALTGTRTTSAGPKPTWLERNWLWVGIGIVGAVVAIDRVSDAQSGSSSHADGF